MDIELSREWFGPGDVTRITRVWENGKVVWQGASSEPAPPLFLDEQPRVYGRVRTSGRVVWPATPTPVSATPGAALVALAIFPIAWIVARRRRCADAR